MWLSAPQVMAIRLSDMAAHGHRPTAAGQAEMLRMGSEKVLAFSQSWWAMCMNWWLMPLTLAPAWTRSLGASPGAARSLHNAMGRASVSLLTAGVTPVHRAVVANRRRLSRRGKL
jgi:hypothetical protein